MEFFRVKKDIPFMRHALLLNAISLTLFALAVFFLVTRGLNLSVEFTGGTVVEVAYQQPADLEVVRGALAGLGYEEVLVQHYGSAREVLMRLPPLPGVGAGEQSQSVLQALRAHDPTVELRRTEFVGPQVGQELVTDGMLALLFVIIGITVYLAFRFEWKFSIAAIVANLHDVVIILGFFAFFQWEFSLAVLAAVLAVLGYSVNESVVIFDRIRETFKRQRKMSTEIERGYTHRHSDSEHRNNCHETITLCATSDQTACTRRNRGIREIIRQRQKRIAHETRETGKRATKSCRKTNIERNGLLNGLVLFEPSFRACCR